MWFIGWVSRHFCEGPVNNPSVWKESLTWIVPWIRSVGGGHWKGDVLVADLEELETIDASEIYSKRLNAKEVIFLKQGEFIFPIEDGRIKHLRGDQDLRTSNSKRQRPIQGESHLDFLGESEGSLPPLQDPLPDAGEAINAGVRGENLERRHNGCGFWGDEKPGCVGNPSSKAQCKGSLNATKGCQFYIPNRRWNSKIAWKRPRSPRIHSMAGNNL